MVGGDGLDGAVGQRGPEGLLIGLFAQRRCADEAGRVGIVGLVIAAVVEQEVVRAGLDVDLLAARSCGGDLGKRLLRAQVDDHDWHVRDLGDAQQMRHGLGLERIRAAARMRRRPHVARGLVLLDEAASMTPAFYSGRRRCRRIFSALRGRRTDPCRRSSWPDRSCTS